MLWKMLRTIHWWSPFTQSYHWNHPEISVTSVTSSPRLWSTSIRRNFSSYDDIVCRSFSPVPVTDSVFITYQWLPSNDVSRRLDSLYRPLWLFFERFTTLNYTNCVNYIDFIVERNSLVMSKFTSLLPIFIRVDTCWIFMNACIASALSS